MTNGTQADLARHLGISREAVRKLIKNRERTGCPAPIKGNDRLYDIEKFAAWYVDDFKPRRGPNRGIRAEV